MTIFDVIKYPIDERFLVSDIDRLPYDIRAFWVHDLAVTGVHSYVNVAYIRTTDYEPEVIHFFLAAGSTEQSKIDSLTSLKKILHDNI